MTGPKINGEYRRRPNLTAEEIAEMRSKDAAGIPRKRIAVEHNCTPGSVTRKLGAVRAYKGLRVKGTDTQSA